MTTNFVIAECHALVLKRLGQFPATEFLRAVTQGDTHVVRVAVEDEEAGLSIIFRYNDKAFSLVDAISFAVMERLGLRTAFSFDRNFAQYGFDLATP